MIIVASSDMVEVVTSQGRRLKKDVKEKRNLSGDFKGKDIVVKSLKKILGICSKEVQDGVIRGFVLLNG